MKKTITAVLVFMGTALQAQNVVDWNGAYVLQLSDFQSSTTQIGDVSLISLHTAVGFDFSFYMSNTEFLFTKNFNSKVNNSFKRNAASLIAPDSLAAFDLLDFARYEFDLSELYARKFRQKLFEVKGAFSNINFCQPLFDATQKEYNERHALAFKYSDFGRNKDVLRNLHNEVLGEIQELSDFCKDCKPKKKKK